MSLHHLIRIGHFIEVQEWLASEADIEAKLEGWAPIHYACMYNRPEITNALINAGADIEARDKDENTPLHEVCVAGNLKIVRLLLTAGAKIEAVAGCNWTPLQIACAGGHVDVVCELLAAGANIEARDKEGLTPLHLACQTSTEIVRVLVAADADLEARCSKGWTPLHYACARRRINTVKELIIGGANRVPLDNNGKTPARSTIDYKIRALLEPPVKAAI